jgi:adenylate kinase
LVRLKVIAVTGSVCSGKTTLSKKLAFDLGFEYIDVNKIIEKHPEVVFGFNKDLDSKEINVDKFKKVLVDYIQKLKKDVIIDSHLSHFLPKEIVSVCIVLKCSLNVLKKRLKERGYTDGKIRENLDAEIMDSCFIEALELGHDIILADSSNGLDYNLLLSQIENKLKK